MKYPGFTTGDGTLSRRQFAALAAGGCALAGSARFGNAFEAPATEQGLPPAAPYLALQQFIEPGHDEFAGEKVADDRRAVLNEAFRSRKLPIVNSGMGHSPCPLRYSAIATDLHEAEFDATDRDVAAGWARWVGSLGEVRRVQFFMLPGDTVRFEVASRNGGRLEYRVGLWQIRWQENSIVEFKPVSEHKASSDSPWLRDVTAHVFRESETFRDQLSKGIPYWRARLDPATGIDIYGSNGIAVGDVDGDGQDEVYVCQPGGLPNRLFKFEGGGRLTDITDEWGVGLLDDTSCALFLDLRNSGRQDLVVLRANGPVLYLNAGKRYRLREDAFRFATPPKGGFTGMAAADFNRDGKLDLYLCCYVYFQSEAQYTYASPYWDARNGPPNFLFRNELASDGTGFLVDCTAETGLNDNNDRFSFAPAWCDFNGDGWPDLYVANDFGRKNLYRNEQGKFRDIAAEAGVEDIGPGMSASWFDFDGDGNPDLYVANMWTESGQRLIEDQRFKPATSAPAAFRGHTMGNSLLRNTGTGKFEDVTATQGVAFGRWAWGSGGHDLDNDGHPEILVTCGMLTNRSEADLSGFFWRQVVAQSSDSPVPSVGYQNGWNAINQFAREDYSWSGRESNVLHVRRGDRFFDFSGVSGFDFAEDSRAFAVTDFDGDGRPDIILKSRLGPQVRVLQNNCAGKNASIAFRLRGTQSNRDAIGARVRVDGQTKWVEAGSGFLSQHSKTLLFGTGTAESVREVEILWPSGARQKLADLQAGRTYSVVEGSQEITAERFKEAKALPSQPVDSDNTMRLHDTWLQDPVPLPTRQSGPGLFVIREAKPEYAVFRRYLFDWRTELTPPLPLLLNGQGEVVKVYGELPSESMVRADLKLLQSGSTLPCLPFPGNYVHRPRRDYFKFGAGYLWAGEPESALVYLGKVLQQNPGNARVYVLAGQIQLELNRMDEAAAAFRQAIAVQPAISEAYIGLGDVAVRRSDQDEAAAMFTKALEVDGNSAEAANGLGLALAKLGKKDQARQYFERAISLKRNYADAVNNLAVLYSQEGQMGDAIAAWRYGIQVSPDEDILYLNLGRTYVLTGQKDKARVVMQELLDRKPGNLVAQRALEELDRR